MSGQELYTLYFKSNFRVRNIIVEPWEKLPADQRNVWHWMAAKIKETVK